MLAQLLLDLASGKINGKDSIGQCLAKAREDAEAKEIFAFSDFENVEKQAAAFAVHDPQKARALDGVALAVSDALLVKDMSNTASSALLENFVSPYDAAAVENLKQAGATIIGKTRIPEFGIAPQAGEKSTLAVERTPEALERLFCHAALGVDAGGELRAAASMAGLTALKPSYGLVSRYGIVSTAPSLEAATIITHCPDDVAPLLQTVAGHDPRDITTNPAVFPDIQEELRKDPSELKIGYIEEFACDQIKQTLERLEPKSMNLVAVSMPSASLWDSVYSILYHGEAGSQLGRYGGIRFGRYPRDAGDWDSVYYRARGGFGLPAKRAAMLGAFALSQEGIGVYHDKALRLRSRIVREFAEAWALADILLVPTSFTPEGMAARRGASLSGCAALALPSQPLEI